MPAARVVRWTRMGFWISSNTRYPMFNLRLFPGLFSLLNTCLVSNESVHRDGGFVRIKSTYDHRNPNVPTHPTEWPQKRHYSVHYSYLRPNHDVFLLNYRDLIASHRTGASINLQSFTHLVFHGNHIELQRSTLVKLLELIQTHCPNIERVSILASRIWCYSFNQYAIARFIDIDENLLKLKLWYPVKTHRTNPEANIYGKMRSIMDTAATFISAFKLVYEEMNTKSMAFWKNVQVVPVLDCGSRNPFDESDIYIPGLQAYACSNKDGNLETTPCERSRYGILHCSEPS